MTMERISDVKEEIRVAAAFQIFGALFLATAAIVLAYDCFAWLKYGQWSTTSLSTIGSWAGWNYPYLEWRGAQKIFDSVMELPLCLIVALCGILIMSTALSARTKAEKHLALLNKQHSLNTGEVH